MILDTAARYLLQAEVDRLVERVFGAFIESALQRLQQDGGLRKLGRAPESAELGIVGF